jgi:hypothetical protein
VAVPECKKRALRRPEFDVAKIERLLAVRLRHRYRITGAWDGVIADYDERAHEIIKCELYSVGLLLGYLPTPEFTVENTAASTGRRSFDMVWTRGEEFIVFEIGGWDEETTIIALDKFPRYLLVHSDHNGALKEKWYRGPL